MEKLVFDPDSVGQLLRKGMLENDLGLKEAAHKIGRSIATIKRALNGSMGERTAYRILNEFGNDLEWSKMDGSVSGKNDELTGR